MNPMLEVHDVYSGYGKFEVLHGVSIHVEPSEIVCIIGPNGSGKSTLLRTIFGLLRPRKGAIRFSGQEITFLDPEEKARIGIAYIPQGKNIFPSLTVMENLEMGATPLRDPLERKRAIWEILERFPMIQQREKARAGTLSGGEKQVLAMARAIMVHPGLILLDEPSIGLAPRVIEEVYEIIKETSQRGVPLLVVEQNARKALGIAHRGYVLDLGKNRLEDSGGGLLNNEEVKRLYLGGS
jgi:ABC-type branched-subunit amino acid transport system ATPase component